MTNTYNVRVMTKEKWVKGEWSIETFTVDADNEGHAGDKALDLAKANSYHPHSETLSVYSVEKAY